MRKRNNLTSSCIISFAVVAVLGLAQCGALAQESQQESKQDHDQRMEWWRDARFGMFVHWGVYAVPAGEYEGRQYGGIGEWIMNSAKIPRNDYEKFAAEFNPQKFDADFWIQTAKTLA
jgi:alpha-L-fucosidase